MREEHKIIPLHAEPEESETPPPIEEIAPVDPDKTPSDVDSLEILDALLGVGTDANKRMVAALQFRRAIELLVQVAPLTETQLRTIPDIYEPRAMARDDPLRTIDN